MCQALCEVLLYALKTNEQSPLGNLKSNTHFWGKNLYNADDIIFPKLVATFQSRYFNFQFGDE